MGFLSKLLGLDAGKATTEAAGRNRDVLAGLDTKGTGIIDTGYGNARGYLDKIVGRTSLGPNADGIYGDALGLNGAEGNTRAQGAFTAGPGYQFALDAGLNALDRRNSAAGRLQSGNADLDAIKYAEGTAAGGWQDWLKNLNLGINRESSAYGDQANLATGETGARLGFAGDIASGYLGANNQQAGGEEANSAAWGKLGGSLLDLAGTAVGRFPMPKFGGAAAGGGSFGYGGFGR